VGMLEGTARERERLVEDGGEGEGRGGGDRYLIGGEAGGKGSRGSQKERRDWLTADLRQGPQLAAGATRSAEHQAARSPRRGLRLYRILPYGPPGLFSWGLMASALSVHPSTPHFHCSPGPGPRERRSTVLQGQKPGHPGSPAVRQHAKKPPRTPVQGPSATGSPSSVPFSTLSGFVSPPLRNRREHGRLREASQAGRSAAQSWC
jgi:hypothetical protein